MNLTGPDGKAVWVDDAYVVKARANGYRDATPEEVSRAKAGDEPGQAFGEGVARTVLPGISDRFMQGFRTGRQEDPNYGDKLREENPNAALAGEIGGAFVPTGAPAVIGRMGEGARLLGGASKLAQRALQGGVETGLYGLSNGINEDAMGDPKITAEHVASETIAATLAGAAGSVVLGKFGDIGKSALIKAFGGQALKQTLDDAAEKAFMRTITVPSDLSKKATRKNFSEIARFGIDEGMASGLPSKATVGERAVERADQAWNEISGVLGELDQHKGVVGEMNVTRRAVKDAEAAVADEGLPNFRRKTQLPATEQAIDRPQLLADNSESGLRAPQLDAREQMGHGPHKPFGPTIEGETIPGAAAPKYETTVDMRMQQFDAKRAADRMAPLARELKFNPAATGARDSLEAMIQKFRDPAEAPRSFSDAWATASWLLKSVGQGEPEGLKGAMFKLRGELQDEIFTQAREISPELGQKLERANRDYYLANRIGELAQKSADKTGHVGLYDMLAGMSGGAAAHAAFGGVIGGPLGAAAAGVATHVVRDRGGFVLASALDAMSKSQVLKRVAAGFQKHMQAQMKLLPAFGGRFRPMLEDAAAKGADALLETHLRHWNDPEYRAATGLEVEPPESIPSHADRAHRFGALNAAVEDANSEIDKQYNRMLGTQAGRPPAAPEKRAPTLAEYEQITAQLRLLMNSRNSSVSPSLSQLAPTTAGVAAMQIASGAQYLLDRAPKNPYEGMPPALSQPWAPSKSEMRSWLGQVDAIANPRGLLDSMRRGDATPEAVEAVKEVYPKLFEAFKTRLLDRLADQQTPVSRKLKGQIDVVLGNLDDPQVMQLIQATHKRVNPPNTAQPDGRSKIDVDKNLATQAQKMEEK